MDSIVANHVATSADFDCQLQLLPGVSRTFALTIPQLPEPLRTVVTNAYLLCRIADTIEDDTHLTIDQKADYHQQFRAVLAGEISAEDFADELAPLLAEDTPPAEKLLIQHIPVVIRCLESFTPKQQAILRRCVNIMSQGMPEFQRQASIAGLADLKELDRYCYYVAGVVGEMLTELFCDYLPVLDNQRAELMTLAVSFGQGLQMTNILKDYYDDQKRGVCWLPRTTIDKTQLIRLTKNHLKKALQYTLMIPPNEVGIRRFCLWAIGLAVLTLNNIQRKPNFTQGSEVKVSRRTLKITISVINICCRNNRLLNYLFARLSRDPHD